MENRNKAVITKLYEEFFNQHKIEAADLYVREDYIQHNPGLEQGRDGLKRAFGKKFKAHPEFCLSIQMMIAEGDMVAVYLKNVGEDGSTNCRIVDIYRLENEMLAEHWDVLQPCQQNEKIQKEK